MNRIIFVQLLLGLGIACAQSGKPKKGSNQAPTDGPRQPWILVHADELDTNRDGQVDYEAELVPQITGVLKAYDRNRDGHIAMAELEARGLARSVLGGFVKGHAKELDRDSDGVLTQDELTATFTKFFRRQDTNRDGILSKQEQTAGRKTPSSLAAPAAANMAPDTKPNVVLILIDDMGWNEMGFAGNRFIETPNTDAWVRRGVHFKQAYASAPNCAPTRACLMTGQTPPRHGVYTVVDERHAPGSPHHRLLAANTRPALDAESVTIAEALRAGGYRTAMVGMWNLGRGRDGPQTPMGQGFEHYVSTKTLGFEKDRYQRDDGTYLTDAFTDAAIDWSRKQPQPFFLYVAYHAVHGPFEPKPELLKKYEAKAAAVKPAPAAPPAYAATVESLDQNIGRLMTTMPTNTVVIFHSDNGGERRRTEQLREGKGSLYEGGLRVPSAMWGPGIPAGRSVQTPIASIDFYPTILGLARLPSPKGHLLDGLDLSPLFAEGGRIEREALYWHFPCYIGGGGPSSAIRMGDWKLIEHFESKRTELFNLRTDPGESRDLSAREPEQSQRLTAALRDWQDTTGAPRPTQANPAFDPSQPTKKGRDQRGKGKAEKGGKGAKHSKDVPKKRNNAGVPQS